MGRGPELPRAPLGAAEFLTSPWGTKPVRVGRAGLAPAPRPSGRDPTGLSAGPSGTPTSLRAQSETLGSALAPAAGRGRTCRRRRGCRRRAPGPGEPLRPRGRASLESGPQVSGDRCSCRRKCAAVFGSQEPGPSLEPLGPRSVWAVTGAVPQEATRSRARCARRRRLPEAWPLGVAGAGAALPAPPAALGQKGEKQRRGERSPGPRPPSAHLSPGGATSGRAAPRARPPRPPTARAPPARLAAAAGPGAEAGPPSGRRGARGGGRGGRGPPGWRLAGPRRLGRDVRGGSTRQAQRAACPRRGGRSDPLGAKQPARRQAVGTGGGCGPGLRADVEPGEGGAPSRGRAF